MEERSLGVPTLLGGDATRSTCPPWRHEEAIKCILDHLVKVEPPSILCKLLSLLWLCAGRVVGSAAFCRSRLTRICPCTSKPFTRSRYLALGIERHVWHLPVSLNVPVEYRQLPVHDPDARLHEQGTGMAG